MNQCIFLHGDSQLITKITINWKYGFQAQLSSLIFKQHIQFNLWGVKSYSSLLVKIIISSEDHGCKSERLCKLVKKSFSHVPVWPLSVLYFLWRKQDRKPLFSIATAFSSRNVFLSSYYSRLTNFIFNKPVKILAGPNSLTPGVD